jgi:DNA integrity scanning protein DisA with diadenylate cyclase activity
VYRGGRLEAIAELSERTGNWEFMTPRPLVDEVTGLLDPSMRPTLEHVLEVAREMVNSGYGGLFVVGERPPTLETRPPKVRIVQPLNIASVDASELAEIVKLDGATFVTTAGLITSASEIIINKETAVSAAGRPNKPGGARRTAALRTSIESPNCAAVCVSQNGSIDIYVRGGSWPVSESITGIRAFRA